MVCVCVCVFAGFMMLSIGRTSGILMNLQVQ